MTFKFPSIRTPGAQQKALDKAYLKDQDLASPPPAPTARVDAGPDDKPGKRSFSSHFTSPEWLRGKASERESATQSGDWPKNANWDAQRAPLDKAGAVAQLAEWRKLWEDKGNPLKVGDDAGKFARQSFEGVEVDIDRPAAKGGGKTEHRDVQARRVYAFAMTNTSLSDEEREVQFQRAAEPDPDNWD